MTAVGSAVVSDRRSRPDTREPVTWTRSYIRRAALADGVCALLAGLLAIEVRFVWQDYLPVSHLGFTAVLPALWCGSIALAGGYEARFIGVGSDEFRRVMSAGASLTACVALVSYALKADFARAYVMTALPSAAVFDLVARYWLRKRLHRRRSQGLCMQRVVAVGHAQAVSDLVAILSRDKFNGLNVVAVCLAGRAELGEIAGVPVCGGLGSVSSSRRAARCRYRCCPRLPGDERHPVA